MKTIKIWDDEPSPRQLDDIAAILNDGQIMIWPTDTIYGIACDALNGRAVERICKLKGINPAKTNLSIVCADISQAAEYARFDNKAFRMLRNNTPGPFTFIFRAASTLPKVFKGRKNVGIRIPACNTDIEICKRLGRPIMTTSLPFDSDDYVINPELIAEEWESKVDLMLDGGNGGTEPSTVIDCTGDEPEVMRQGIGELE